MSGVSLLFDSEIEVSRLVRGCINLPGWIYGLEPVRRWIEREVAICKKVLRLRSYLYLKIPWVETSDLIGSLLLMKKICEIPADNKWLTIPSYLDPSGEVKSSNRDEFERRKAIYDDWVRRSNLIGSHLEKLIEMAFIEAGYSVERNAHFQFTDTSRHGYEVEIDALCVRDKWKLGVQVKNVVSEVFIDPNKISRRNEVYERLVKEFDFCSRNGLIPILIAPFIDTSFYCFDDAHRGLHCQTLLQLLRPEDYDLCCQIKGVLKFGNIRAVDRVPHNVQNWIAKVPDMWEKRFGSVDHLGRSLG